MIGINPVPVKNTNNKINYKMDNKLCIIFLLSLLFTVVKSGWIDTDTLISDKFLTSKVDKRVYELVFSDEFNEEGW